MTKIRMHTLCRAALALAAMAAPVQAMAQPDDAGSALLDVIPGDAWAALAVRNLSELDRKITNLSQAINAPPVPSLLQMAKAMVGLPAGVNDDGGAAMVLLPTESADMVGQSVVVLVPARDYGQLLSLMEPEDAGEGMSRIFFRNEESYVAQKGGHAILCQTQATLKRVLSAGGGLSAKLSSHQRERFGQDDITLWLNAEALLGSKLLPEEFAASMSQSAGVGSVYVKSLQTLAVALELRPEGINLGLYIEAKGGSSLANVIAGSPTPSGSMLTGLPAEALVFASGAASGSAGGEFIASLIQSAVEDLPTHAPVKAGAALTQLGNDLAQLGRGVRGVALGLNALGSGGAGTFAASMVVTVDHGAGSWPQTVAGVVSKLQDGTLLNEEVSASMKEWVAFTPNAEAGAVAHLAIHADRLGISDESDLAEFHKVFGSEGALLRIQAVDDKHVAVTFGGGAVYLAKVGELVKSGAAPVSLDANVQRAAGWLPAGRFKEGFVSVAGLGVLLERIGAATGQPFDSQMLAGAQTPIAISTQAIEKTGVQTDMIVPMDVLKALTQVAMMGAAGGPPDDSGMAPIE